MKNLTSTDVLHGVQMVLSMGYGSVVVKVKNNQIDLIETSISVKQAGELQRIKSPAVSANPMGGRA
ncbi:MAG: hypothetical protein R3B95_18320 [Nitrospirales bacterium]|nr:hypothetical protein [Nitrospirales bacterium]